jgi:hypothetical protein
MAESVEKLEKPRAAWREARGTRSALHLLSPCVLPAWLCPEAGTFHPARA